MKNFLNKLSRQRMTAKKIIPNDNTSTDSEEKYRIFINATSDFAFLKDENFRHIMTNLAYQQFLGKTGIAGFVEEYRPCCPENST